MRKLTSRTLRRVLLAVNVTLLVLLCMPAHEATGQTAPPQEDATGGAKVELDLEALLTSRMVFDSEIRGDIWQVTPGPGRFLVQVPFKVTPGKKLFTLDRRTVELKGPRARFLTWRVRQVEVEELEGKPAEQQNAAAGGDSAGQRIARGRDARNQVYGELTGDFSGGTGAYANVGPSMRGGGGMQADGAIAPPVAGVAGVESFEGRKLIPRFSDSMDITPDGNVKWEMKRRITNGEIIESGQLYTMKIDYAKLNEHNPAYKDQPQTTTRQPVARGGEEGGGRRQPVQRSTSRDEGGGRAAVPRGTSTVQSREAIERERAQAEMERVQARLDREAFQRLREEVQGLDTDFEQQLPMRVWAIFEMSQLGEAFEIKSELFPHLDWTINYEQLALLRQLSLQGFSVEVDPEGRFRLGPTNVAQLIQLGLLAEDKNVYSRRAVAYALNFARMGQYTEMGNQLFFIFQSLLEGSDSEARQIAQRELLSTVPPTVATASLLKHVVRANVSNAEEQLDAIGAVFVQVSSGRGASAAQVAEMVNTAQQVLDDPNGPPPGKVLEKLLDATRGNAAIIPQLVTGVQFGRMPDARLQQALVTVVERAGDHPLASGWLNQKFIGATNPALIRRSLEVIVEAEAGAQSLGPAIQWGMTAVLGMPQNVEPTLKAKIARPIPIDTVQHGMIRALQHGDATIRDLAWRALPRFWLPPEEPMTETVADNTGGRFNQPGFGQPGGAPTPTVSSTYGQPLGDRYEVLLEAALDQSPTPVQIVTFLAAQPDLVRRAVADQQARARRDPRSRSGATNEREQHADIDRAVHALVQIVLRGSSATSTAASRELVGSGWNLDLALEQLEFGERQGFAMNIYEAMTGRVPVVTSVLRQRTPRNPVVEWFGKQLSAGNVPQASQWIEAFKGGETELLDLATINDRDLARGAIAALVAAAGGDDRDAKEMADRIRNLTSKDLTQVREAWDKMRGEIFAKRIRRMEGSYRLVLRLGNELPARQATGPAAIDPLTGEPIITLSAAPKVDYTALPADRELVLGVLQLRVDGDQVSFGNQNLSVRLHKQKLAIVIDKPSEFKNFEHPDMEALALDRVEGAVELVPLDNGQWQGAFNVGGGKAVYVLLLPATET